jgi:hypothetical protein
MVLAVVISSFVLGNVTGIERVASRDRLPESFHPAVVFRLEIYQFISYFRC